jgi:hypothetical protein
MRRIYMFLLIVSFVSACTLSPGAMQSNPDEGGVFTGIDLSSLSDYQTIYTIEFQGDYTWRYSLITYHREGLTEKNLYIDGVGAKQNPGDIRLVTDGQTNWMTGPAVDDECYLFPNDFDIGYSFLTPDDIFPPSDISPLLAFQSEGENGGLTSKVYSANVSKHDGWRNLKIEIWLVESGDYPNFYTIEAEGDDPLFDAGEGRFSSTFTVGADPSYQIAPVGGCEYPFPLPDNATKIVRFPGLISFEINRTPMNMANDYQNYLTGHGWTEDQPLVGTDKEMQMSYTRGGEVVVLSFKAKDDGTMVEIILQ